MSGHARVLVHLASGIGNIMVATPLLGALERNGFIVDVLLDADYPGMASILSEFAAVRRIYENDRSVVNLRSYSNVLAAVPPFCWKNLRRCYRGAPVYRPPDRLFYKNEQAYYLEFARSIGCDITDAPHYSLPGDARPSSLALDGAIVLAPGSKPLGMTAKRWPFFSELSEAFDDVVLVGTPGDLYRFDGTEMRFPDHVRSVVGRMSLKETASVLRRASAVVANDCGLGHLAGALGVTTILLFGPTPDATLGPLPPNVTVLRTGLECEPCWFRAPLRACGRRIDCLNSLGVEDVVQAVRDATAVPQREILS